MKKLIQNAQKLWVAEHGKPIPNYVLMAWLMDHGLTRMNAAKITGSRDNTAHRKIVERVMANKDSIRAYETLSKFHQNPDYLRYTMAAKELIENSFGDKTLAKYQARVKFTEAKELGDKKAAADWLEILGAV